MIDTKYQIELSFLARQIIKGILFLVPENLANIFYTHKITKGYLYTIFLAMKQA